MPRPRNPVPTYRLHKQSGQAVTTLRLPDGGRKDVLLGVYDTDASKAEYQRVLAEWRATAGRAAAPSGLSDNEVILAFWQHAGQHYRHPDGKPTNELNDYRLTLKPLKELYGHTGAADFGPLALKAVRQHMVEAGLCRGVVNQRVGRIKRMYKWAVSEELIPHGVFAALATIAGLAKGRSPARETEPVKPVPEAFVDAVRPFVLPEVWAMIEVQRLTGCRPGEACGMRTCDLDMTGNVWLYKPARHKTAWRGKDRVIALGPKAQAAVKPFLTLDTGAYLFSPARAMQGRALRLRAGRKSPVQRSQRERRGRRPKVKPGERYTRHSYLVAIRRACDRAGVPHWHPNQLRHNYATDVRRRYGLEAAQVGLGHTRADVTQVYAERDLGLALKVAAEVG
jgi:integrase